MIDFELEFGYDVENKYSASIAQAWQSGLNSERKKINAL